MFDPVSVGHVELGILPDKLGGPEAEHPLRSRVHAFDDTDCINRYNGSGLKQALQLRCLRNIARS